jgi:hypothetical protein
MRKNLKTGEPEAKNENHGQNEQSRVTGQRGKGTKKPTREHVLEKGEKGTRDPGK